MPQCANKTSICKIYLQNFYLDIVIILVCVQNNTILDLIESRNAFDKLMFFN